jgi:SAM-dependent methyltransferase
MRMGGGIGQSPRAVNGKLDGRAGGMACGAMLEAEAARLCDILLAQNDVSPLLNLGSSTRRFRETIKPHIETRLFKPLRDAGIAVHHSDLKSGPGIDFPGDVLDSALQATLQEAQFKCVLLANVLEHVRDRAAVIAACERIAGPGGLILATVPSSHPYHADPIDSGYRPAPTELAAAFTRSRMLLAEEVVGPTFADVVRQRGSSVWGEAIRTLLWCLASPGRPKSAWARVDRWRWLRRPYWVSIALVRVSSS